MALDLSRAKPFEHQDWEMLESYLSKWYQRSVPRYYESPLRLAHQPHVFKWIIIDEHLCIIKRRQIMGHPVCYLILPPLGPNPVSIIRLFQENKISTMLSDEDMIHFGIGSAEVSIDKNNAEFCYPHEYAERGGINKNQVRRALNNLKSYGERFKVMSFSGGVPLEIIQSARELTTRWLQQRKKKAYNQTFFVEAFNELRADKYLTVIMESSRCIGYLISIKTPNGIINDTACIDYEDNPLKDTTLCLLHHNAQEWLPHGLATNRGAAVRGSGSISAKQKLRPHIVNQNYKLITEKLQKHEYEALWVEQKEEPEWL